MIKKICKYYLSIAVIACYSYSCKTSYSSLNNKDWINVKREERSGLIPAKSDFSIMKVHAFSSANKRQSINTFTLLTINKILFNSDSIITINLYPGKYNVNMSALGYKPKQISLVLEKNKVYNIDAYLEPDNSPLY